MRRLLCQNRRMQNWNRFKDTLKHPLCQEECVCLRASPVGIWFIAPARGMESLSQVPVCTSWSPTATQADQSCGPRPGL